MKFKQLEVCGFKSFADKLEIKFGAGITGIVGPNGCGKSNVADAVRWVLGEQSAKLLRGTAMSDVIFNGTEQRKSLSYCEVSLVFDNLPDADGVTLFPNLPYKEVVISRKLYRSGESEYLINKQVCRLKDITELLRDCGMAREGYSIIGQGRIDQLLSAKPEDRRSIFEEAAGISKHKAKKIESERKLARAEENLSRVTDILTEKGKQLEPLTRQSENARRWLSLRDSLKHHEINTYIYQYDTTNESKRIIKERLAGVMQELELRNREAVEAANASNEAQANLANADRKIESLREELLQLTVGIEREAGEIKLLNERQGHLVRQAQQLTTENKQAEQDYESTIKLIEDGTRVVDAEREALMQKRAELEAASSRYMTVAEEMARGENAADKRHSDMIAAMDRLSDLKANLERLKTEKETLKSSVVALQKRIEFLTDNLNVNTAQSELLQQEIAELAGRKNVLGEKRDAARSVHNEAVAVIHDCANRLDKLTADFHVKSSRRKMFIEMKQANEALGFSVKKLLGDAKTNAELAEKIEGVVAQIIKVTPGFELAVETALGNAVQNIVTKSEDEAKFLIRYLKERRYGQITFLPITSVKPRSIDSRFVPLLSADGCYGCALDYITYDPRFEPVLKGLLGGTVFVRDMDAAVTLAKKSGYGIKIVTKEGDVIQTSGSITGGSKKSELTNIFGYEREIESLSAAVTSLEQEIAAVQTKRDEAVEVQNKTVKSLTELGEEIHDVEVLLADKSGQQTRLGESIHAATVSIGNLEFEVLEATERIEAIDRDLNSVTELENIVSGERSKATETQAVERQKFESLRAERDRLYEERMAAQTAVSKLEAELNMHESEVRRLQANSVALLSRIEYNHTRLNEIETVLSEIEAGLKAFSSDAKESDSERVREIRELLANLDSFKQGMQASLAEIEERRTLLMEQIQVVHEKKTREDNLLIRVDTDIEVLQNRVLEEYELSYEACLPFKEEGYNHVAGGQEIVRLKRQMQSLGNVNLEAIELCKQVYEEYHELDMQRQDLYKAKTDLQSIIASLSKEMLTRFNQKFEQIRTNFVKIFKELFNGGSADLQLLDSDNPLEAGINIVAQPPEKRLQTITLLSGGERALTAIAILFAILKLRPMPFCILDEIEAALDDANAGRFAKYLRRFAEDTQFIVITHRKPTMELADALYGVTMEEKGVSKIVSVKLSEAVSVAEKQG